MIHVRTRIERPDPALVEGLARYSSASGVWGDSHRPVGSGRGRMSRSSSTACRMAFSLTGTPDVGRTLTTT